jgi:carboxymethylenebutenolidase
MTRTHRRLRGAASYAVVAGAAALAGAAIAWVARGRGASPLDPVTTHGEWVRIPRGTDTIRAYVAYPERKSKAPAVIVIHEIFGLTDWEPTVVDRLAKDGFVAVVPDLLSSKYGKSPADADSGRKLVADLEPERITAAVVCYGPAPDSADIRRIQAPVLGIYGENDARITGSLPTVVAQMQSAGKTFAHEIYPGTGHGFLKPGRQGSDSPQVGRAWKRILEFLHARLGGG